MDGWTFGGTAGYKGRIRIPSSLVSKIATDYVVADVTFPDGTTFSIRTRLRRWQDRHYPNAGIDLPRATWSLVPFPSPVEVVLRPMTADEEVLTKSTRPGFVDERESAIEFTALVSRFGSGEEGLVITVPASVTGMVQPEDWRKTWWVEVGDRPRYPTLVHVHETTTCRTGFRAWIPVPQGMFDGVQSRTRVRLVRGWIDSPPSPLTPDGRWDWAACATDHVTAGPVAGTIGLGTYGNDRFWINRYADSRVVARLLGAYQAEGNKKHARTWSIAGVLMNFMREVVDDLESLGVQRERLSANVRRPWAMSDAEAVSTVAAALALPLRVEGGRGGIAPTCRSVHEPESHGQLSVTFNVVASLPFLTATLWALDWVAAHVDDLPRDVCLQYALGYMSGDGTIRASSTSGRPVLGLYGPESETRVVAAALSRGLEWRSPPWRFRELSAWMRVRLERAVDLLRAGAFRHSMSRARLLYFVRGRGHAAATEFLEELVAMDVAAGGNPDHWSPGKVTPGRKCIEFPAGERPDVSDVPGIKLKQWRPAKGPEEDALVERAYAYYRDRDFPFPEADPALVKQAIKALGKKEAWELKKKSEEEEEEKPGEPRLHTSKTGLRLLLAYHPEIWSVACGNESSPLAAWNDDEKLRRALRYCIRMNDSLGETDVRTAVATLVSRRASIMRPAVAKALYDTFHPGRIVDPCAGWGSRMLAAVSASIDYVGVDASSVVQAANGDLRSACVDFLGREVSAVDLHHGRAEELLGSGALGGCDLVFTSPPYFDMERYLPEEGQSYVTYPTPASWEREFLRPLLAGAAREVEAGGRVALAVRARMESQVQQAAEAAGLREEATWLMVTPRHHFHGDKGIGPRLDPILIFRRPS